MIVAFGALGQARYVKPAGHHDDGRRSLSFAGSRDQNLIDVAQKVDSVQRNCLQPTGGGGLRLRREGLRGRGYRQIVHANSEDHLSLGREEIRQGIGGGNRRQNE